METSLKGRQFLVCLMGILVTGAANGQTMEDCVQKFQQDISQQNPDVCAVSTTFLLCFAKVTTDAIKNSNMNLEQLIEQLQESLKTNMPQGLDIDDDKLSKCKITPEVIEQIFVPALFPNNTVPYINKVFEKDQLHKYAKCIIEISQLDLQSMELEEKCDAVKNEVACYVRSLDLENIDKTSPQWSEIEQLLKNHQYSEECSLKIEDVLALASRSSTIYGSFVVVASVIISFMMFY